MILARTIPVTAWEITNFKTCLSMTYVSLPSLIPVAFIIAKEIILFVWFSYSPWSSSSPPSSKVLTEWREVLTKLLFLDKANYWNRQTQARQLFVPPFKKKISQNWSWFWDEKVKMLNVNIVILQFFNRQSRNHLIMQSDKSRCFTSPNWLVSVAVGHFTTSLFSQLRKAKRAQFYCTVFWVCKTPWRNIWRSPRAEEAASKLAWHQLSITLTPTQYFFDTNSVFLWHHFSISLTPT